MSSSLPSEGKEGRWKWTNDWEFDDERLEREQALSDAPVPWPGKKCAELLANMEEAWQLLSEIRQEAAKESSSAILVATEKSWEALGKIKSIAEELQRCPESNGKGQLKHYWMILDLLRNRTKVTYTSWRRLDKGPLSLTIQQQWEPRYKRLRETLRKSITDDLVTLPRPYIVSKVGIDTLDTDTGGVDLSFQYTSLDLGTRTPCRTSIYRWMNINKYAFGRVFKPGREHAASIAPLKDMVDPHRMPLSVYTEFTKTVMEVSAVPCLQPVVQTSE
jgi:hypothetical protein